MSGNMRTRLDVLIRKGLDAPWKVITELRRVIAYPYVRLYFALCGVSWGQGWKIYGCPVIQRHRGSKIEIGQRLSLRSIVSSNPLGPYRPVIISTRRRGAMLRMGDDVAVTGGTICAAERIEIGSRVTLGANCLVVDSDFHPLEPERRRVTPEAGATAPVVIEDDVFVGMNSLILKGVHIGHGSVIGAGSVVTSEVPSGVICAGNPARVIRSISG